MRVMSPIHFLSLAAALVVGWSSAGHAQAAAAACTQQSQKAMKDCQNAADQIQNFKNTQSQQAADGSAGTGNSTKGFTLAAVTKNGAGRRHSGRSLLPTVAQIGLRRSLCRCQNAHSTGQSHRHAS